MAATDDIDALVALGPDALVHFGPTAAHADDNIRDIGAFLRAGIDVCSTAMTPWVWPSMSLNPPSWIDPITVPQFLQGGGEPLRRLEEHLVRVSAASAANAPRPLPGLARREALEAEPVDRQPGDGERGDTADGPGTAVTRIPAATAAATSR